MAVFRTHLHVISRHVVELYVRIQLRKASMNFHDCRIVLQSTHHIVIASPRWMRVRRIIHSAQLPACSRWVRRCLGVCEQAQQLLPQNTVYQTICMQGIVGDVEATCFTADSLLQSAALGVVHELLQSMDESATKQTGINMVPDTLGERRLHCLTPLELHGQLAEAHQSQRGALHLLAILVM